MVKNSLPDELKIFFDILHNQTEKPKWLIRIHDSEDRPSKKNKLLLKKSYEALLKENQSGYGIFTPINETDGKGIKKENITKINAIFIDKDNGTLPETFFLPPTLILSRKKNKSHVYWKVKDFPIEYFTSIQKHLSDLYGSDSKINNINRIMRLPVFRNKKTNKSNAYKIIKANKGNAYSFSEILDALGIKDSDLHKDTNKIESYPDTEVSEAIIDIYKEYLKNHQGYIDGERNHGLFIVAATGKNYGLNEQERLELLVNFNEEKIAPPKSLEELKKINKSCEDSELIPIGNLAPQNVFEKIESEDENVELFDKPQKPKKKKNKVTPPDEIKQYTHINHFLKDFYYIEKINSFKHKNSGAEIQFKNIDTMFNNLMPKSNGKPTITASTYVKASSLTKRCLNITYTPGKKRLIPNKEIYGMYDYNTYIEPDIQPGPKTDIPEWFDRILKNWFDEENEIEKLYLLDFLTFIAKGKGKPNYGLVLQSNKQGAGKSYICELMARIVGFYPDALDRSNAKWASNDDLSDKSTAWLAERQLILVEEVMQRGRLDVANRFKTWITASTLSIRSLYHDPIPVKNYAAFILLTNHPDAIRLDTEMDRKYLVLSIKSDPLPFEFWKTLWGDLDTPEETLKQRAQELLNYLYYRDIEAADPRGHAPPTQAKVNMAKLNKPEIEKELDDRFSKKIYPFHARSVYLPDITDDLKLLELVENKAKLLNIAAKFLAARGARNTNQLKLFGKKSTERGRLWVMPGVEIDESARGMGRTLYKEFKERN